MNILNAETTSVSFTIGGNVVPVPAGANWHLSGIEVNGVNDGFASGEVTFIASGGSIYETHSESVQTPFLMGLAAGIPLAVVLLGIVVVLKGLNPSLERA